MADKRMNQFQQVTDAEYVYVEDMNGSQGKIEWIWGPFISFGAEGYQVQLKFDYKGEGIKFRVKYKDEYNNTQYTLWRAISFT